jgi:dehydrogenase/reductase SDR family protein 7
MEYLTLANFAIGAAVVGALTLLRVATSDADLSTLAALRGFPRRGAFSGKVVFITGASSGIGEALAYELARGGATLILAARRMEELHRVATRCLAEGAPGAEALRLDVTETGSLDAVVAAVLRKHGRIDMLFNNAGRSQRGLVEATPVAVDEELLKLNVVSVMALTKAVLRPALAAGAPLHIVNTTSVAGKLGSPISATYAASKHALQGFFDALRMETGFRGVRVNNCCPGPVESEITLHAITDTPGKALGQREDKSKRMPAERCALLMAAAAHAGLEEAWMAPQPILFFVYVAQYWRGLYFALGTAMGKQRVTAFKAGNSGCALGGGGGMARERAAPPARAPFFAH